MKSDKERGEVWKDYMERIILKNMIGIVMWKEMQQKVQYAV